MYEHKQMFRELEVFNQFQNFLLHFIRPIFNDINCSSKVVKNISTLGRVESQKPDKHLEKCDIWIQKFKVVLFGLFWYVDFADDVFLMQVIKHHHMHNINWYGDIIPLWILLPLHIFRDISPPSMIHVFVVKNVIAFKAQMQDISQICNIRGLILSTVNHLLHEIAT